ncbi:uncharacterized protein A1O5_12402 [Cladophialophora psammophila CBS 110553]|uniref:Zn(2)-C6 fungal-type domain-containing protein n=1 Tax=Cladophialophora psammophila CBS 110553 TaxID=1182543 RepID=W9WH81_9EURO|nr:uncharacterized protein A1O5_12402 [Cladophialophora psammophila CBS 110553]EXJ57844.1 hypothetical protein A1O5_12402 [Cladophialophora psammophila CBS 110553]
MGSIRCHLCRQRKTKCDRRLPHCSFCVKAKVRCQYVTKTKKRGLRAGYVSQLENRIGSYSHPLRRRYGLTLLPESLEQEVERFKHERTTSSTATATPNPILSPPLAATATAQSIDLSPSQNSISNTPSVSHVQPLKSDGPQAESDVAVADLMTLSHAYLHTLADSWFKETQPWYPILSRQHIQSALDSLPLPLSHIDDVVLKAVIALQIAYSSQAICLGYHGRHRLSQYLRSQVVNEAFSKASLKSVQALLIIAILDYGSDNIPSTFSLLAVCRRMCENIGLFRKLLNQMQLQSPAQVGPPAIGSNTGDELAIPLTWASLAMDAVSTLGISWRDVSAAVMDHLSSVAYVSTPDLRDSFRSHTHLAAIGLQPLHNFLYDHEQGRYEQAQGQAFATCDEIYHNLMNYVRAQPSTSYTLLADGLIDFDPNLVLTSILSHASVVILYARLIEVDGSSCNEIPLQRCHKACEDIALALRSISDADAELSTPLLGTMLFVAARFKLLIYRKTNQQREPIFDTLMHGISMCGRRWAVARRQDIVLRAAIVEVDTGNDSSLPAIFWNVKKSHLDISEELKEWIEDRKQSLYIGSLNGPYV